MNLFENAVLRREEFSGEQSFEDSKDHLHIVFGVDENFARGMGICMTSIILNNDEKIVFHVITDGIRPEDIERIKRLAENAHVKINVYYVNPSVFEGLRTTAAWSQATYYRLLIGKILNGRALHALYLDADVLCVASLNELRRLNYKDNIAIAVIDYFTKTEEAVKELSLRHGKYFNAGILYVDIDKWNREKISDQIMDEMCKLKSSYMDQDFLNIVLDGKVYYVDRRWNYQYDMFSLRSKLPEDIVLIHYVGYKPWQTWTDFHFMFDLYQEYTRQSPWYDVPQLQPITYKHKRMMAKSALRKGNYLHALKWYCAYLKEKCGK